MPSIKIISQLVNLSGSVTATTNGPALPLDGALTFEAIVNVLTFTSAVTATLQLQKSNDGVLWVNETTTSVSLTGTGVYSIEKVNPGAVWMRVVLAVASGSFTASVNSVVKGPN